MSVFLHVFEDSDGDTIVEYGVYVDEPPPHGWMPAQECDSGSILAGLTLRLEQVVCDLPLAKRRAAHQWLAFAFGPMLETERALDPPEFYLVEADGYLEMRMGE